MKLQQLHENKQYPTIRKMMHAGLQSKQDFSFEDLAWIASGLMVEYISEWDWEDQTRMMFDPDKGFKHSPGDVEAYLSDAIEFEELEDDFADEGDDAEGLKVWLADKINRYRVGKIKY